MPYERELDRESAITPYGMPRSYGQTHQSSLAKVGGGRQGNPRVKGAILGGQQAGQAQPVLPPPGAVGLAPEGPKQANPGSNPLLNQFAVPQGLTKQAPGPVGGPLTTLSSPNGQPKGGVPVFGSNPEQNSTMPVRQGFGGMSLGFSGLVNPMNYSGFNLERAFAGGDPNSVKDGFARTVGELNLDLRGLEKPQVGEVLRSQVVPALNARGIQARMSPNSYDVIEVFSAERGWEPIDVVQNAGSADAAWAWQDLLGSGGGAQAGPMVANDIYAQTQQSILNPPQLSPPDDNLILMQLLELMQQQQDSPLYF